jgi:hypothetical protein
VFASPLPALPAQLTTGHTAPSTRSRWCAASVGQLLGELISHAVGAGTVGVFTVLLRLPTAEEIALARWGIAHARVAPNLS